MPYAELPQEDDPTTPLRSGNEANVNVGFAKAAIALNKRLEHIRQEKRDSAADNLESDDAVPPRSKSNANESRKTPAAATSQSIHTAAEISRNSSRTKQLDRSIRILRAVQGVITASLSIAIVVLEARTYADYRATKDVPGAWPSRPNLTPIIMMLSVAVAAIVFDAALLVAYVFPRTRIARRALVVAVKAHYVITCAKTVSYLLTAVACRADVGGDKAPPTENSNLWAWTCSAKASNQEAVNHAAANCQMQSLAWDFAVANVAIEVIGVVVNLLVQWRNRLAQPKGDDQNKKLINDESEEWEELDRMGEEVSEMLALQSSSPMAK